MVQLRAEFQIPLTPAFDRALSQLGVFLIRTVGCANGFADVGGCRQCVWQRSGINQHDIVSAFLQLERRGDAVNSRTDNNYFCHASACEKLSIVTVPLTLKVFSRIVFSFEREKLFKLRITRDDLLSRRKFMVG